MATLHVGTLTGVLSRSALYRSRRSRSSGLCDVTVVTQLKFSSESRALREGSQHRAQAATEPHDVCGSYVLTYALLHGSWSGWEFRVHKFLCNLFF